ncbi:MAG: nucleotidyltransferase domain-containing protein [Caldanaerobacter subterraneus]|nr:nucleotidyltransferase domain-containing protein [Caldanaerobacter subterraneus]
MNKKYVLSKVSEKTGLSVFLLGEIIKVLSKYKSVEKAVIFGSRGRGDFKRTPDIDICVFWEKITHTELNLLQFDLEGLNTPLSFDVVHVDTLCREEFKESILKDGVEIYDRRKIVTEI